MDKKTKGYTEEQVLNQLKRKSDVRVIGKRIYELREGKGDVGIGTRGKIDFLVRYRGYVHMFVTDFPKDFKR